MEDMAEPDVSPLLMAVYRDDDEAVRAILGSDPDLNVFEAAAVGDADRVRALVAADTSLARTYAPDGFHALGLAAFFHHPAVVTVLIAAGADVQAPSRNGMAVTALHSAVADGGDRDCALALIHAGADVQARQRHGWTALHGAAEAGDRVVVEALLAAGADPDARHDGGKRPAELAREKGHLDIARLLERDAGD